MAHLINAAQKDTSIKAILLHGGRYYSSGNDLSVMASYNDKSQEEARKAALKGIFGEMNPYLRALNNSVKPVVAVVRGGCVGIAFTTLALVDFVYVAPDATFMVPFMKTFQSPEGSSTLYFPEQMGKRKAAEVLLLDRALSAKEAVECGFANSEIPELLDEPEWFDIAKVPAITKLLSTDYTTLVNCKRLLNAAKDNQKFE